MDFGVKAARFIALSFQSRLGFRSCVWRTTPETRRPSPRDKAFVRRHADPRGWESMPVYMLEWTDPLDRSIQKSAAITADGDLQAGLMVAARMLPGPTQLSRGSRKVMDLKIAITVRSR